jgi:hypothetical protein
VDAHSATITFGTQRPARDVATLILLLLGFTALAVAFWMLTLNWAGLLLPLGFLIGAYGTLRTEVREIEIREDALYVRTFLKSYRMPRAHITGVIPSPSGTSVEVLNGNRYMVTPPDVDSGAVARTLEAWLGSGVPGPGAREA